MKKGNKSPRINVSNTPCLGDFLSIMFKVQDYTSRDKTNQTPGDNGVERLRYPWEMVIIATSSTSTSKKKYGIWINETRVGNALSVIKKVHEWPVSDLPRFVNGFSPSAFSFISIWRQWDCADVVMAMRNPRCTMRIVINDWRFERDIHGRSFLEMLRTW